jgi:hypothetical protein
VFPVAVTRQKRGMWYGVKQVLTEGVASSAGGMRGLLAGGSSVLQLRGCLRRVVLQRVVARCSCRRRLLRRRCRALQLAAPLR